MIGSPNTIGRSIEEKRINPHYYREVSYLHLLRLKHNKTLKYNNKLNLDDG